MTATARPVPRETGRSGIMRAVTDLLTAERVLFFRMNAGDRIVPGKGDKRYRIKGHPAGTADLLFFLPSGAPVWCECKRPHESLSAEQCEFAGMVQGTYNHLYLIIEDAAELQAWLRGHKA